MDAPEELDAWLKLHVAEPRRTLARGATSNLSDYATCEAADLEDVLKISTWPPLARSRFLRAWRKLKGDEAPAPATVAVATVATQTEVVAAPAAAAVPWRTTGSTYVGRQLTRTETGTSTRGSSCRAAVVGWQPADESDFLDAAGRPAALYKIRYLDGELDGEEAELEEYEVLESLATQERAAMGLLPAKDGADALVEESSSDDEDTPAPPKGVAMRRVGDTEWRIFATGRDASRAFPGVNESQVSKLVRNDAPNAEVRRLYEARPLTADDPVPLATTITSGKMACEVRRVGDKNWRRFESRSDAAKAFPGLDKRDISDLINKPHTTKKSRLAVREMYEARNVVDSDDEQPPPCPRAPPSSAAELAAADARPAAAAPAPQPKPPAQSPPALTPAPPPQKSAAEHAAAAAGERPAAAPQPKKPSPAPRPRTPPLEAFRKHAGPDGDRKAAVAAFFAAQSSDEAPPPKKARTDDAIGDGEVLSEMF